MTPVADFDSQLMMSVRHDDAHSFALLLRRNRDVVVNYLTGKVRNEAIAEELAQDVFLRVYRSRRNYQPAARFSTWLYRITTNVALNHFRDEKRHRYDVSLDVTDASEVRRDAADRAPLAEEQLVREVLARHVRRAVWSLPPKQRVAVILHRYEEMNYAQIAQVLQTSPCAVKALVFRAHETLRGRLGHLQFERRSAAPAPRSIQREDNN
jgi:RNA polymerase sigma-70 factor (ECF subfamily)